MWLFARPFAAKGSAWWPQRSVGGIMAWCNILHAMCSPEGAAPFFLLSDKGLDFYGNEETSHRVYMLNEALDRFNLYWLFIIFFCSVLSSNLNFLQLSLSSLLELHQFTLCLSIPVCCRAWLSVQLMRSQVRLLKGWDESHGAFTSLFFSTIILQNTLLFI